MEIEKGHCSFGPKLAGPKSEIGELLLHGDGGGGRARRAHRRGGFHGGTARPKGNSGEGRRPVVVVGSSWLEKVARTRAVIGVALMEQEDNW
jgi:hypothetical protein